MRNGQRLNLVAQARKLIPVVQAKTLACLWKRYCGLHARIVLGGNWNSVYQRFRRWVKADVFKGIFDAVSDCPDMEYAMIDGTIVKVHRHGQGAKGGLKARLSENQKAD